MTPAQEYAAKLAKLIANAKTLSPQAERAIAELLADANRRILAKLTEVDPQSYTSAQFQNILRQVDQELAQFRVKATTTVNDMQQQAATMASNDISAVVGAGLSTGVSYGALNPTTLRIAQGYTADLISGLSADAAAKLKGAIQRAFLGGQTMQETIHAVGHALEGGKFSGIFTDVGDRAMKIATNEILRVHSISGQARLEELAKRNPKVKKQWKHVPAARVPRPGHLLVADGQVVDVDKPFIVEGEELMYPRDPSGSAENTINCHCVSLPYIDDSDLYATDEDRKALADAGLSVELS